MANTVVLFSVSQKMKNLSRIVSFNGIFYVGDSVLKSKENIFSYFMVLAPRLPWGPKGKSDFKGQVHIVGILGRQRD